MTFLLPLLRPRVGLYARLCTLCSAHLLRDALHIRECGGNNCILFLCTCICVFVCLNATCVDADGSQKKALNPWALEPQVVVSPLARALGMQPRSFRRAASALKP